jgi:hypothetical protein
VRRPSDLAKYGLTPADFEALLEFQHGYCPMCNRRFGRARPPVVDHRHRDGKARGLLCASCNNRLGWLHEDALWLKRAAEYLNDPPAQRLFDSPRLHRDAPPEVPR